MKKILLLPLIFLLSHCEIKMQETKAGNQQCGDLNEYCLTDQINYTDFKLDGFDYRVYHTPHYYGGLVVINRTKEKLEVEKLKLELQKLKSLN